MYSIPTQLYPKYESQTLNVMPYVQETAKNKKSLGTIIWSKTWRLLAAAVCFGLAVLIGWLIIDFFADGGHGVVKVSGLIAPFVFAYWGVRCLVSFFIHLFKNND